jgi:hypothetical protein
MRPHGGPPRRGSIHLEDSESDTENGEYMRLLQLYTGTFSPPTLSLITFALSANTTTLPHKAINLAL